MHRQLHMVLPQPKGPELPDHTYTYVFIVTGWITLLGGVISPDPFF